MNSVKKLTILVVDDDPKVRELIQNYFTMRSEEINCVMAADTQQAVMKLSNQEFDIVLIDNVMPGKLGIDFAVTLKRSIKYGKLPIVLMSGALQQDDVLKAIDAGIKDILVKPFSLKQLNEKVQRVLKKSS